MPRLKLRDDEFNAKELDVAYEPPKFKRYRGEVPPTGTILIARVTKLWWTQSDDGTSAIRLIAVAEQNKGANKKYNGLPISDWLTFKTSAAFRYQPFLMNFGLTTMDIKRKMIVEAEPDNNGDIITSIAGWEVGSDDALCRIVIMRDYYDSQPRAKVDVEGWLKLEDDDELEEDEDDEEDAEEDDDEDEEDEPPARPTRARSRTTQAPARGAKAASARTRRAEPEPEEDDEDDDEYEDVEDEQGDDYDEEAEDEDEEEAEEEDEEPPARTKRTTRSTRAPARASRTAAKPERSRRAAPATARGNGASTRTSTRTSRASSRAKGDDGGSTEEPPF